MKIFLAGMDNTHVLWYNLMCRNKLPKIYGLFSYYYLSTKNHHFKSFSNGFDEVLIDSGAHTFHTARNVDFNKYTLNYANWIDKYSKQKNIIGFFEMDIDNRIGYKNVLKLRRILEDKTDKIIPVWHKNRGNQKFKEMCKNYDYVAVSCLKIEGLTFNELEQYIQIAHKYDCKIHGLGGTRKEIIDKTHFDSVDSISWFAPVQYNNYVLGDVITEVFGEKVMMKTVLLSLVSNLIMIIAGVIAVGLPYPATFTAQAHFAYMFTFVPRIVVGSFIGCYCGQYVNARIMTIMKEKTNGKYLFARTIGSTIGGEFVDSLLFIGIGFLGTMPLEVLIGFILTQYVMKVLIEVCLQPLTYSAIHYIEE